MNRLILATTVSIFISMGTAWNPNFSRRAVNPKCESDKYLHSLERNVKMNVDKPNFLNANIASEINRLYKTPAFVYDENTLTSQAKKALAFPNSYGLTVRFAMKACPNAAILQVLSIATRFFLYMHELIVLIFNLIQKFNAILKLFSDMGLHFDASSGFEVKRAVLAGIPANHISLSSQEFPSNFKELYEQGIEVNLCSLDQVEKFGKLFPGTISDYTHYNI